MSVNSDSCNSKEQVRVLASQAQELSRNEYFKGLLHRLGEGYQQAILALAPNQMEEFRCLRVAQLGLDEIRNQIEFDMMGAEDPDDGGRIV
jgi:hypothetical protein